MCIGSVWDLNPRPAGISSVAYGEVDSFASSAIATPRAPRKAKAPHANGIAVPLATVKMGAVTPISVMAVVSRTPARKKRMKKANA